MKKKTKLIICLSAVLLGILCACLILFFTSPKQRLGRQMTLGAKYLTENNYEEAVIAFTAAIEIEPRLAEAYLGRAEAFLGLAAAPGSSSEEEQAQWFTDAENDYLMVLSIDTTIEEAYLKLAGLYTDQNRLDDLIHILRDGYAATGSEDFQAQLDELDKPAGDDMVQWSDPAMEKLVREAVNIESGPVYVRDLDDIQTLEILGDQYIFIKRTPGSNTTDSDTDYDWSYRFLTRLSNENNSGWKLDAYYSPYEDAERVMVRGNIKDVESLWYFRNLKTVQIIANHISDVSILKRMDLDSANFWANEISDTSFLEQYGVFEHTSEQFVEIGDILSNPET
ncbi:hypothetical protein GPL15_13140 [Clostridium sp. MCC353]|uniref:hypothetical protein n=1 Tax=Clostridium sp. MCC353 TaxID=2592646 RepID=UPI001C02F9DE|nr:hypothetical protein [Clostridium sp. MCC353]MBT9777449.1 hypothetical protein [Clostridium sp. MCC353]